MTDTVPRDAAGNALMVTKSYRPDAAADFPRRTIATIGDLGKLLADYAAQCDRELSDISLSAFWPSIAALALSSMDGAGERRDSARTVFFEALAARIGSVRKSHAACDLWLAREHKRQVAAARKAVNLAKENRRLRDRLAEVEAELQRRTVAWPRAVNE